MVTGKNDHCYNGELKMIFWSSVRREKSGMKERESCPNNQISETEES